MGEKMDLELKKVEGRKCPVFRVSFPHLFERHSYKDQKGKYSCVMLFDKKTDLKELRRAAHNAAVEKYGKDKTKWPKKFKMPFRDGSEKEDLEGYENCVFVTAIAVKNKPTVYDQKKNKLESEDDFYAGCYAKATLIAFAYDDSGNKGISFSLLSLQKVKDGEPFGRKEDGSDFDEEDDGSDNSENYDGEDQGSEVDDDDWDV